MREDSVTPAPPDQRIGQAARGLFLSRKHLCAEAVLLALNRELDGGLSDAQAAALASGLPLGLGGAGCLCGAVSGAALALGLFLAGPGGRLYRRDVRRASRELHRLFSEAHGSTCCRVLTKKLKDDRQAHFRQCADLTGFAAREAARLILERRPELAGQIPSAPASWLGRLRRLLP